MSRVGEVVLIVVDNKQKKHKQKHDNSKIKNYLFRRRKGKQDKRIQKSIAKSNKEENHQMSNYTNKRIG